MNNDLGCYGHRLVTTPHIDRLAREGTRFDRAYCQFPLCSPSRSSLLTGLRPDRTRVHDLTYHFRTGLPGVVTLPQAFMQAGWFVARVGKLYHYGNPGQIGTAGLDDPASWNVTVNPAGRDKLIDEPAIHQYTGRKGQFGASLSWLDADGTDDDHTDGKVAAETIKLIEAHKDERFFIAAGFYKPHTPYVAPRKYFDMLPPVGEIPLVDEPAEHVKKIPRLAFNAQRANNLTDTQKRELRRAYWACINFVDAQVGRLLDALDRLKLREKTIVVFWSDHGYHLGEHAMWQKQTCFEEAARVPLIISAPGQKTRGRGSVRCVELLDLYPTLAALAGIEGPRDLDGASLRPLLDESAAPWDRVAHTMVRRPAGRAEGRAEFKFGRSVRSERWRYTEWGPDGADGVELYDHDADPREWNNLATDPAQVAVVTAMKKHLAESARD